MEVFGAAGGGDLDSGAFALLEAVDGGHWQRWWGWRIEEDEEKWWIGKSAGKYEYLGEFQISNTDREPYFIRCDFWPPLALANHRTPCGT